MEFQAIACGSDKLKVSMVGYAGNWLGTSVSFRCFLAAITERASEAKT